ncbi:acetate/propionate family kinase [Dactylosporangium sucinum]|uniref:Acetate kinase n=1 Tax=Dactylosporangium sucinum TaxID=1424081 RepID=A0A917WJ09_9ACTN|nr:acetate kinase [Dactylosporangium sucinum]GGM08641.1 acetate kinase [Dactylosporangium sucinum]
MILVLNSGSSSVKYRVVDLADPSGGERGLVERIGEPGGVPDHTAALTQVLERVDGAGVTAVGHRVVHGGERFRAPTLVDDAVLDELRSLVPLAPLHNPGGIIGIEAARAALPDVPHVAVFDTAFHATLPPAAATYALDRELAARHGIRRYGFHGTSCAFVAGRTADLLGRDVTELNQIVLHLGNGASVTAIAGGRSVETSMGLTPLEGLVMGTRSGDVDPAIPGFLHRVAGLDFAGVDEILLRRSGLLGLAGVNDMRTVLSRREAGDEAAVLAFDVYCHRIRKYVGAYHAVLGRLDAIVFTAGVGEHAAPVRAASLAGLSGWGIEVDEARNAAPSGEARLISPEGAPVAVCVVPTDEELSIAEQVTTLLS